MIDNRVAGISPVRFLSFNDDEIPYEYDVDMAFSPDGAKLFMNTRGKIVEWTLDEQPVKWTIFQVKGGISSVVLSHNGTIIAVSELHRPNEMKVAGRIHLIDSATGQCIREIPAGSGRFPDMMAFSNDDSLFAWNETSSPYESYGFGEQENRLFVMSLKTGEVVSDSGGITGMRGYIYISKESGRVCWLRNCWKLKQSPLSLSDKQEYRLPLYAYSSDGRWGYGIAPLNDRYEIGIRNYLSGIPCPEALYQIDLASGKTEIRRRWRDPENTIRVSNMATSPDGRLLVIANPNGLHVIDLVANRDLGRLVAPEKWSTGCFVFSPDGKRIAGRSTQGVCIWDVPSGVQNSTTQEGSK